MSLVERALKKLQESRAALPEAVAPPQAGLVRPPATVPLTPPVASVTQERQPVPEAPMQRETPTRVVNIDKSALRAMELMPPVAFERQIASQYQHVKRPLVAAAMGKTAPAVPNGHLIMLASALPGEGKTFTSINLALSMALERDMEVLLVDADVAKPHLTRIFNLQAECGLLDLLGDSTLHPDSFILPTDVRGLSMLPAGKQVANATELLSSKRMEQVVSILGASRGRIVLFDSPPLLLSTESRAIVEVVGQVVMVVRAEFTSRTAVNDALDLIGENKPTSLILNQSEAAPSSGYYGYGSYGDAEPGAASS